MKPKFPVGMLIVDKEGAGQVGLIVAIETPWYRCPDESHYIINWLYHNNTKDFNKNRLWVNELGFRHSQSFIEKYYKANAEI